MALVNLCSNHHPLCEQEAPRGARVSKEMWMEGWKEWAPSSNIVVMVPFVVTGTMAAQVAVLIRTIPALLGLFERIPSFSTIEW